MQVYVSKYKGWMRLADEDLYVALLALKSSEPRIHPALFHAQQCAEHALKAFLVFKEVMPPKSHDTQHLVDLCSAFDEGFRDFSSAAAELDPYFIKGRYPTADKFEPDIMLAKNAIHKAEIIFAFVEQKIS